MAFGDTSARYQQAQLFVAPRRGRAYTLSGFDRFLREQRARLKHKLDRSVARVEAARATRRRGDETHFVTISRRAEGVKQYESAEQPFAKSSHERGEP